MTTPSPARPGARGGPNLDPDRRRALAGAFLAGGEHYDRVRPGYPSSAADWLIPAAAGTALDLGAGTGKFTAHLVARGLNVLAVDPSADMLAQLAVRFPSVRTLVGSAERLELPDASIDVVTVAQAWHWFDTVQASREVARVLRPGGVLGLVWNQLDVAVPWVHRLTRIMHAGDVHRPEFVPPVGPQFSAPEPLHTSWTQELFPEEVLEVAKSRSFYLSASPRHRERMVANLRWYLYEHLGHVPGTTLQLPYTTQAWRTIRLGQAIAHPPAQA